MPERKLTPAQRRVLANLEAGRPAGDGFSLTTVSRRGGFSTTMQSLIQRGHLTLKHEVTDAGRAALKE